MKSTVLLALLGLATRSWADPSWPSSVDELEEIMFQLESFGARKFSDTVSPCQTEASGPGRLNAAEWLRTAFHDMSTASVYFNTGGLDASLQYELTNTENKGPGLTTTIEFMAPYVSRKSSLSDLIAMGVYTSVRACGGPPVAVRAGRKDATTKGNTGVPQPENSVLTFQQQFDRMGFTVEEMIQVTACGHTLGGVHSEQFPDIVLPGTGTDGQIELDSSRAVFDNKVITEYLDGSTKNPLVVGPAVRINKHADFKVFNSDGNATMEALADAQVFRSTCQTVLQKMIEVVPPGVTLTDVIMPYAVKPVDLQLTLNQGGNALRFTGYIRVRTTDVSADGIDNVVLTYKNRNGEADCGSDDCTITTTIQGVGQGFDDTFGFFPIEHEIPASTGISSFTLTVNYADGSSESYDNNGESYPIQDAVVLQFPQSCLLGSSGALTVTAAVRNDRKSEGANALVSYKMPQTNSPSSLLRSQTITLEEGDCVGEYTFFSTEWTIPGGKAYESFIDVQNGDYVDGFKSAVKIGGSCLAFENPAACGGGSEPSSTSSTSAASSPSSSDSTSQGTSLSVTSTTSDQAPTSASSSTSDTAEATTSDSTSTSEVTSDFTSTDVVTSTSISTAASPTVSLHHRETVGEYNLVSCWTDLTEGKRALLQGKHTAGSDMTLEGCMEFCSDYVYWGTEYGQECFCGNSLDDGSDEAPLDDCNMPCAGDDTQYCGAGDRLELYSTTASQTSATPTPTASPSHLETVNDYALVGCWTELPNGRALRQRITSSPDMTNAQCAEYCSDYRYFATQFGSECYCGSHVAVDTQAAPLEDCSMSCGGDSLSYCGGRSRLELYINPDLIGGTPEQPLAAGSFSFLGCYTDSEPGERALSGSTTSGSDMTNEVCAEFCEGFEFFGTEYGGECYCGDSLREGSEETARRECGMLCEGSVVEYCGAGNRLSLYGRKVEEILEGEEE